MSTTTPETRLSLAEAVRDTDLAMEAVNLSGLAHSFPEIMNAAWDDVRTRGGGTDQANRHPLSVLWVTKMAQLAGLCVTAPDPGFQGADGTLGGGAIHDAFVWLRSHRSAGV